MNTNTINSREHRSGRQAADGTTIGLSHNHPLWEGVEDANGTPWPESAPLKVADGTATTGITLVEASNSSPFPNVTSVRTAAPAGNRPPDLRRGHVPQIKVDVVLWDTIKIENSKIQRGLTFSKVSICWRARIPEDLKKIIHS